MGRDLDIAADAGLEVRGELFQLRGAQRVRARDRGGRLAAVRGDDRVIGAAHRAKLGKAAVLGEHAQEFRSEEHTSELQPLMRSSYAVFCLTKKKKNSESSATYANDDRSQRNRKSTRNNYSK